ncbi:MAG: aminoglycoside phosphotransferase family protein [Chloroflexota bacterium]|nr:aminoglycoside phosphotransferase family protein [Chloroflexota bacterium]
MAGPPDETIRALLQRWLPGQGLLFARADSGVSTPVYRVDVTATGEVYFLRLAEVAGERREAEVHVHQALTAAGLPVPMIATWEAHPPELDRSAALTTSIPGKPLRDCFSLDNTSSTTVVRAAGQDLARINRVPVRGFGWVQSVAADGALVAEHATRSAWTVEYAQAAVEVSGQGILCRTAMDQLHAVLGRWLDHPDQVISSLAHGDFDATHIYLEEQSAAYTGIIDFGEIRGADQVYDLGHALLQDHHPGTPPIFPAVCAGYQEVTSLPDDVMMTIREQAIAIATRQLAIFLRRAAPRVPSLTRALETLLETAK